MLIKALAPLLTLSLVTSAYAVVYAIDIDTQRVGGADTSSTINTGSGFSSLDVTANAQTASVDVNGVTFSLASVAGSGNSRNRGAIDNLTDLTRDFVYEDGPSAAIVMLFGGAGDLAAGTWQVEVWASDDDRYPLVTSIVGLRTNSSESIQTSTFAGSQTDPYTFTFESDGVSAYDVFVRENSSNNRARLNAVRLTQIPEPSSAMMLMGVAAFAFVRRRR